MIVYLPSLNHCIDPGEEVWQRQEAVLTAKVCRKVRGALMDKFLIVDSGAALQHRLAKKKNFMDLWKNSSKFNPLFTASSQSTEVHWNYLLYIKKGGVRVELIFIFLVMWFRPAKMPSVFYLNVELRGCALRCIFEIHQLVCTFNFPGFCTDLMFTSTCPPALMWHHKRMICQKCMF